MRTQHHMIRYNRARSDAVSKAVPISDDQYQTKILTMVAFSLTSGIVVISMAYLPILAASLLATLNVMPF